ncbi:MAG: hypothetical protein OEZ20_05475 [candidate division WOR-3 bacterium]|nr:hypothetical protein [candidate division WOR-3 bacterium]
MRIFILAVVGLILLLAIFLISWRYLQTTYNQNIGARAELLKYETKFLNALAKKDGTKIHRLFNPAFQRKFSKDQVQEALVQWYSDQSYRTAKIGIVNIVGISGHITSWISFRNSPETKFIYQYWINNDSVWQLMWLTGILNHEDFEYGDYDTLAQREIMQLMLEETVSDSGFEKLFQQIDLTNTVVILRQPDRKQFSVRLPKNRVLWLTEDELKENYPFLGINTYLEFGIVRILDGIAIGALDIVPIHSAKPPPRIQRRHSVSMLFKKENKSWIFTGYGSIW